MGKRYYCDYCDKSFPDTILNRRNHNKGYKHVQNKKIYFNHFENQSIHNSAKINDHFHREQLSAHIRKFELNSAKKNRERLMDKLPDNIVDKTCWWLNIYCDDKVPEILHNMNLSQIPSLYYESLIHLSTKLVDEKHLDSWGVSN